MLYDCTWNGKLKRNIVALLIFMLVDTDVSDFLIAGLIVGCALAIVLSYEASRAEEATARALEAVDTAKIMENELKVKTENCWIINMHLYMLPHFRREIELPERFMTTLVICFPGQYCRWEPL